MLLKTAERTWSRVAKLPRGSRCRSPHWMLIVTARRGRPIGRTVTL